MCVYIGRPRDTREMLCVESCKAGTKRALDGMIGLYLGIGELFNDGV